MTLKLFFVKKQLDEMFTFSQIIIQRDLYTGEYKSETCFRKKRIDKRFLRKRFISTFFEDDKKII